MNSTDYMPRSKDCIVSEAGGDYGNTAMIPDTVDAPFAVTYNVLSHRGAMEMENS